MVSYLDPNQEAYFVDDGDETRAFQAEEDDVNDPMLMGNAALMNPSLYARDDFTGTSGIVDDDFANFLDRGAAEAQRAMYAAEAAERARAAQRRREREAREREEREREDDQAGSGFFGRLHQSAVDLGRRKLCPNATAPNFPGENHAPCANFCGPGTRVYDRIQRGDQPVNSADAACKQHDLDYARIVEEQRAGKLTSEQVDQQVREADDRMLRAVERTKGEGGLVSRFHHAVGKQVISAKKKLEDAGVLDQQKFVNPEDSNDSEAAAPEQEGGSRGITAQQNNGSTACRYTIY
jgi:hypothetical protein